MKKQDINTKQLTRSALCTAIYALLLLVNQQTSLSVESLAPWLFVFCAMVCTAWNGPVPGGLASLAMGLITLMFGGFTTWFYSWSSIITGYLYGIGVWYAWSSSRRLLLLFLANAVSTWCIMSLWAGIFGVDYSEDLLLLQTYAPQLNFGIYVVLLILLMAILQTICIHLLAILLLKRLHIALPPIKPISALVPSRPIALASLVLFALAGPVFAGSSEFVQNFLILVLFLDGFVLIYYGVLFFLRMAVIRQKRWLAIAGVVGAFVPGLNLLWMLLGLVQGLLYKEKKPSRFL